MAYTPPKPKKVIIHCGYTLHITDEVKKLVTGLLPGATVVEAPITAIHYQAGQELMTSWYNKKSKSPAVTFLKGMFVDTRLKYAVGHFTIEGVHTWVILSKGTQIAPANLKRKVSAGEVGVEIPVEKVQVQGTAYKFEDYRGRHYCW